MPLAPESYALDRWVEGGLDFAAIAAHARTVGGPALRALTFQDRARILKALADALKGEPGAEDGAAILADYAARARRELPNARFWLDGEAEILGGGRIGQRFWTPLPGFSLHIGDSDRAARDVANGLAPSLLAGVPVIVNPAAAAAELAVRAARRLVDAGVLPAGALQLVIGPIGELLERLSGDDVLVCSGQAGEAAAVRSHPAVVREHVRVLIESRAVSIPAPEAGAGELDRFVAHAREVALASGASRIVIDGEAGDGRLGAGIAALTSHMRRAVLEGPPAILSRIVERQLPGAPQIPAEVHPFRKRYGELAIGETLTTASREITLEDIEHFAHFTGDTFYAHMDEEAAKKSPIFGGRVAHGYLILAFAAGLFVDPDPGPVLANYGLDSLRFTKPMRPGDSMRVTLTVKAKSLRTPQMGEVRWGVVVTNQAGETTATYDLLTMNAV